MWRQLDCLADCIEEPSEDKLGSGPRPISLEKFLDGCRFLAVGAVRRVKASEDGVQGVEEGALDLEPAACSALH
jgi:hypothetical protein